MARKKKVKMKRVVIIKKKKLVIDELSERKNWLTEEDELVIDQVIDQVIDHLVIEEDLLAFIMRRSGIIAHISSAEVVLLAWK